MKNTQLTEVVIMIEAHHIDKSGKKQRRRAWSEK